MIYQQLLIGAGGPRSINQETTCRLPRLRVMWWQLVAATRRD